jgi:acetylornithine deacetylase
MRALSTEAGIVTRRTVEVPGLQPVEGNTALALALALTGSNATSAVSYATEAGLFQQAGLPTIVCGPGSIDQAHKPDEYVEVAQLAACAGFLERLARAMAS